MTLVVTRKQLHDRAPSRQPAESVVVVKQPTSPQKREAASPAKLPPQFLTLRPVGASIVEALPLRPSADTVWVGRWRERSGVWLASWLAVATYAGELLHFSPTFTAGGARVFNAQLNSCALKPWRGGAGLLLALNNGTIEEGPLAVFDLDGGGYTELMADSSATPGLARKVDCHDAQYEAATASAWVLQSGVAALFKRDIATGDETCAVDTSPRARRGREAEALPLSLSLSRCAVNMPTTTNTKAINHFQVLDGGARLPPLPADAVVPVTRPVRVECMRLPMRRWRVRRGVYASLRAGADSPNSHSVISPSGKRHRPTLSDLSRVQPNDIAPTGVA